MAAKDYKMAGKNTQGTGIQEHDNDSFDCTGHFDLQLNEVGQFNVKSSEIGQLDLESKTKEHVELKLNKLREIESNKVEHSYDKDEEDDKCSLWC